MSHAATIGKLPIVAAQVADFLLSQAGKRFPARRESGRLNVPAVFAIAIYSLNHLHASVTDIV